MEPQTTESTELNLQLVDSLPQINYVARDRLPCFLEGPIKEELKRVYPTIKSQYPDSKGLGDFNFDGNVVIGSNPLVVAAIYPLFRQIGLRPAISADDRDGKISAMVKGNYYTDFSDLVVHSATPTREQNEGILRNLIDVTEDRMGSVQFPFKVTGVTLESFLEDCKNGYGLKFVQTDDFDYVHDARLNKENRSRFDNVDEIGIPIFDEKGKRTWYSKQDGLSRLCLDGYLGLYSDDDSLSGSNRNGRVVLVDAEGVALQK
ncbi:hypothetical protein CMI46_01810 [Candidatus Pacearchaeota archaeon]|nr:hypothetical protein [Candidatus Pacearchaeota archaeon]|tara:strand:+ start:6868 stop:7650 length:783 start_codon:yes stop_codon:yes gene_type:complete